MHSFELHRSNREVSADWFRVLAWRLIETLEDDCIASGDATDIEAHLVYCIYYLGEQCDSLAPDPREERWLDCPVWFEAWEGEGEPLYFGRHPDWQADAIVQETIDRLQEPVKDGFDITWESQPCRLCVRDGGGSSGISYYSISDNRGRWFLPDWAGDAVVRALKRALSTPAANLIRQTRSVSDDLAQIDYARLAEDLASLGAVVTEVVLGSADETSRDACLTAIDRLWMRLNDGRVDRIDVSREHRVWLEGVWDSVLWAWRFFELTRYDSRALWDLYEDRHARFIPSLKDLRLHDHMAAANQMAGRHDATESVSASGRWRSSRAGYPDGLTILQVMTLEFQKDRCLNGLSQRAWAARLNCSKGGVSEPIKVLFGSPQMLARGRVADLDDFAFEGGRLGPAEDGE